MATQLYKIVTDLYPGPVFVSAEVTEKEEENNKPVLFVPKKVTDKLNELRALGARFTCTSKASMDDFIDKEIV